MSAIQIHVDLRSMAFFLFSCRSVHFVFRANLPFCNKKQKVTLYILFPQSQTVVIERQVGNMHNWVIHMFRILLKLPLPRVGNTIFHLL